MKNAAQNRARPYHLDRCRQPIHNFLKNKHLRPNVPKWDQMLHFSIAIPQSPLGHPPSILATKVPYSTCDKKRWPQPRPLGFCPCHIFKIPPAGNPPPKANQPPIHTENPTKSVRIGAPSVAMAAPPIEIRQSKIENPASDSTIRRSDPRARPGRCGCYLNPPASESTYSESGRAGRGPGWRWAFCRRGRCTWRRLCGPWRP